MAQLKKISLLTSLLLLTSNSSALELGAGWKASGNVKAGYVNYNYNNPPSQAKDAVNKGHKDSKGFYFVPKLSITTPTYKNFLAKATVAAVTDFGINDPAYESRNFVFDSQKLKSFAILQELYMQYKDKSNDLIIGRYELVTPLLESDDYYMLADTYETARYINSYFDGYKLHLGYIDRMAGVWDSGVNGTQLHSMSETSFVSKKDKENANDSGIVYGAVEFETTSQKAKLWDYYVVDLYNIALAQYEFKNSYKEFSYNFALQYVNYSEVGKLAQNTYTNINYSIYALKLDSKLKNGLELNLGASKFSDGNGIGETLSAWGGFPTFTYGYVFNWFETGSLQNASLYKAELAYDLSKLGLKNSWIGYRHTYYDLDATHSSTASGKPQESMHLDGLRFKYTPDIGPYFIANYEHRILDNEPNAYAFRLIGGYSF